MPSAGKYIGPCPAPATGEPGCIERCDAPIYEELDHQGSAKICCSRKCRDRLNRERRREARHAAQG